VLPAALVLPGVSAGFARPFPGIPAVLGGFFYGHE